MRTIEYGTTTTHVPAFLTKLWKLVTDVSCNDLISWNLDGSSFIIYDEIRFSKELLPMYFKHNNMASFVRQLNMYGFRKLSCIDQGGMHCYKNEIEFHHPCFKNGQEKQLENIKRKIPNSKSDEPKVKQEYIDDLISSIKVLKGKQDYTERNMREVKRQNRMLWRHVELLTERYSKQQSVLQQLLPFFVNMVRSRRDVAIKRKSPLMIDEGDTHNKMARMSPPYYVQEDSNSCMPSSPDNVSNRGPVIHDVTEMETSKMYPGTILCSPNTTTTKECEVIVDSPLSCSLESSEQAIGSPFTEPGSMETLNILNQNFERRSRSNSLDPRLEFRRSPINASTSSIRLPSPCSMPGTSNSMPCFTSASSYIPSNVVIDETTSDVPLSPIPQGLMSPFQPKIEDTCTDSGMYSMNSMINDRVSSIITEETASILNGSASSMLNNASPLIDEVASTSHESKFTPTNFMPSIKTDTSEIGWLMNQSAPPYPSEPSIDNWLGQIFKSDNLTPGCSLPQPQQQEQAVNVSFV